MKIEIEKVYYITLSERERTRLLECLNYCYHRLFKHTGTGLHRINMDRDWVDNFRKTL